ncbi:MAG: radical SAM protein [Candidatus Aminicenantes bacterium]|nr:radical SAM protein [Candidatus Aminicenantes bacterium]
MEKSKLMDELNYLDGWYGWETDKVFPFRWMSCRGRLGLPAGAVQKNRFLALLVFSEFADHSQVVTVSRAGRTLAELPLLYQWSHYSVDLGERTSGSAPDEPVEISLTVNKPFPEKYHRGDGRELAVRIGPVDFHNDPARHEDFLFYLNNARLNDREMRQGRTRLESYPLNLGIDLFGKCNISPPCVYCLWDRMKVLEGPYTDAVVDDATLQGYGPFFKSARNMVNCSFGEPLLHPRFQELLDLFQRSGKLVEISTNGQAFTPRTINALAGKHVFLYISLDAATRETYAKIRNDKWDPIVPNLRLLNEERKKAGNFPKIFMVFMPMRVNRGDLEAYFQLCREIEADSLVLRPLVYLWNPRIEKDRGGYHFSYEDELLKPEELRALVGRAEGYSRKYGIPVANQFNFGAMTPPGAKD